MRLVRQPHSRVAAAATVLVGLLVLGSMVIAAPAEAAGGCASLDPFAGRWSASYLAGLGGVPHRTWGLARVSLAPIGVPGAAGGVVANLTYADPTADGYLAAYPAGGA